MSDDPFEPGYVERVVPQAPPPLRLTIENKDLYDFWFAHIRTPEAFVLTFPDFPQPLKTRLFPILRDLQRANITLLTYDERFGISVHANNEPFDLRELCNIESFRELGILLVWWIRLDQRRKRCAFDSYRNVQPHKTWTCECGEEVFVDRVFQELCNNADCPSWQTYRTCTGIGPKKNHTPYLTKHS